LQWGQGITRESDMLGSVKVANGFYLEPTIWFIKEQLKRGQHERNRQAGYRTLAFCFCSLA